MNAIISKACGHAAYRQRKRINLYSLRQRLRQTDKYIRQQITTTNMSRNISFCAIGIVLGIILGFFFANSGWVARPPADTARNAPPQTATTSSSSSAPPLNPEQRSAPLPPGHPSVNDAGGGLDRSGGASSSTELQNAMDAADRSAQDFDAQMAAVAAFYRAGAYERAVVYIDRALKLKPNQPDALTAMGDTKYDMGDFKEAAKFYERALVQRPDDVNVRTDLGNTYFRREPPDYDRAISEYRKALAVNSKNEKTLQNLATAALRKGDKTTARDALNRLAAINPANPALPSLRSGLEQ
jgi:tetratricopeptide (TPR) repeat protein